MKDLISRQAVLNFLHALPPEEAMAKAMLCSTYSEVGMAIDHIGEMKDMKNNLISRASAIDIVRFECGEWKGLAKTIIKRFEQLPPAQPDEEKISDILYNIYRNTSPHTSAEGVAATKYYIREIYREIYGEEGPGWLKK